MGKKVAVINDLSGFGRCSLTAAISVLSAMGVQACPLPTAVLSAQTGYEDYHCVSLTEKWSSFGDPGKRWRHGLTVSIQDLQQMKSRSVI